VSHSVSTASNIASTEKARGKPFWRAGCVKLGFVAGFYLLCAAAGQGLACGGFEQPRMDSMMQNNRPAQASHAVEVISEAYTMINEASGTVQEQV